MTEPIAAAVGAACPLPFGRYEQIVLGHGSGGRLSAELLHGIFLPSFRNPTLEALEDQATLALGDVRLAFTTDTFVVRPIFFPGGDIGKLAVHGTINDLAVGGATPRWLSAAFILEEGLPLCDLQRVVESIRDACAETGVELVTGDTKVVDKGKGDQLFISTSGIGIVRPDCGLSISSAQPGDRILVSGPIGDHGIAILSVREGLQFDTELESDLAPLTGLVATMLDVCPSIRCMRDPTRGGVSSVVNELAAASSVGVRLFEEAIPVRPAVRGACEMLGLDPLYVACEGRLIAVVPPCDAEHLLDAMHGHLQGRDAAIVGEVIADHPGTVTMRTTLGGERRVTLLAGEQLPRIC